MKKFVSLCLLLVFPVIVVAQEQFSVYFDSNKHEIKQTDMPLFNAWMKANAKSKIVAINGYTDEDGSTGFNDSLAQRRVNHVFGLVNGKMMIREDFKTRSYGEQHKMLPDKAKNRKVTIYYIREKDLPRENEILGIKEEQKPKQVPVYRDRIVITDPRGNREEINLDIEFMKKVGDAKAGEKLKIENLNFYENTFAILPESRPRLYELLEIMRANPGLKIKLLGHICCMEGDPRDLSTKRAKAVMQFLNQSGVEKSRLSFEGLGTSQPINPLPEKDEAARAQNRRVEVMVVENE